MHVVPRAVAATLTVLLHLLILFALLRVTASAVKPPPPPTWQQAMVDKLYEAGEQIVSVDIRPGLSARGFACTGSSYVGVGVTAELAHRTHHARGRRHTRIESRPAARRHRAESGGLAGRPSGRHRASA